MLIRLQSVTNRLALKMGVVIKCIRRTKYCIRGFLNFGDSTSIRPFFNIHLTLPDTNNHRFRVVVCIAEAVLYVC